MQTKVDALMSAGWAALIALGIRVLEALALWIVGRWLIGFAINIIGRGMSRQKIDPTLIRYIQNAVGAILNIVLVIAILGFFGVQTTSLAALIAAAGVAIGLAWSGLLANFAAGVFLIILQPFKVGDFVTAGGIMGTVHEIGLFVTYIDTLDNVRHIVGNGKIFGDVIQNYSHNPFRRVDLTAQLAHGVDVHVAMASLKKALAGDCQRHNQPRSRRGDPDLHARGPGAGRASVLQQQGLLAGVLRYQPADQRDVHRRRLRSA